MGDVPERAGRCWCPGYLCPALSSDLMICASWCVGFALLCSSLLKDRLEPLFCFPFFRPVCFLGRCQRRKSLHRWFQLLAQEPEIASHAYRLCDWGTMPNGLPNCQTPGAYPRLVPQPSAGTFVDHPQDCGDPHALGFSRWMQTEECSQGYRYQLVRKDYCIDGLPS